MGIFSFLKKNKNKAVFCGLDNSGKSTIISFLQTGTFIKLTPTMGKKLQEIEVEGTRMSIFDMGGQSDFRDMWMGEIKSARCVVFVIDTADSNRYDEAREEFNKLLPMISKNKINLLIMANKFDLNKESSMGKIIRKFNLIELENFEIMEISAKTGYGMTDAFVKFYTLLTGQIIEKSIFAKAISIYTKGGKPVLFQSHLVEGDEANQKVLEGAFLSSIKKSTQMKVEKGAMQITHFKSEDSGTFIVARSQNFIGSFLWTKLLGIEQSQSEEALKSLLTHLEKNADPNDEESIKYYSEHYITNLI